MASSPPVQKTVEVRPPRSSHKVSVSWDEADGASTHRASRLQFELEECVETKTVTTTTTTKRSYPPWFVKAPRPLELLDAKEYPLASKPTPPELTRFTFDLAGPDGEPWSFDDRTGIHVRTPRLFYFLR